jgi:hypothetical protein
MRSTQLLGGAGRVWYRMEPPQMPCVLKACDTLEAWKDPETDLLFDRAGPNSPIWGKTNASHIVPVCDQYLIQYN